MVKPMTNKQASITVTMLSSVLLALLVLIAARQGEPPIEPIPPSVNTEGLCYYEQIAAPSEPEQVMYYTAEDVQALAKMLYGEARGCTLDNQQKAVWCVLNRVDADGFPDTIIGVLSQPNQFHGYSTAFPVWDELTAVAEDVLTRWSLEKQGVAVNRELPKSFLYFTGTGRENIFREAY